MHAERYLGNKDLKEFMEGVSLWIFRFCYRRLNRDPDIVADFYVHFYEKAPLCMERYRERRDKTPFTGYFCAYIRHEFYNYIRPRNRENLREVRMNELATERIVGGGEISRKVESQERYVRGLYTRIATLSEELRIPLKLHFGMELDSGELRILVRHSGSARRAQEFVADLNRRRERILDTMDKLQTRAAYLNYRIHSAEHRRDGREKPRNWKRWKRRINGELSRKRSVFTLVEIGELLSVNKSTVYRRIERAIEYVRREMECTD